MIGPADAARLHAWSQRVMAIMPLGLPLLCAQTLTPTSLLPVRAELAWMAKFSAFAVGFMAVAMLAVLGRKSSAVNRLPTRTLRVIWSFGIGSVLAWGAIRLTDLALATTGALPLLVPAEVLERPPAYRPMFHGQRTLLWFGLSIALALVVSADLRRRAQASREAALRLEAEDAARRARLSPGFFLDSLSALQAQIARDPHAAASAIDRLASLFRQLLDFSERPTIPLREELGFVEAYLGLVRERSGPGLEARVEVSEALEEVGVPPLALQAMVEAALRLRPEAGQGPASALEIRAGWNGPGSGKKLLVSVEGPAATGGAAPEAAAREALESLRARLARPEDLTLSTSAGRFRAEFAWAGAAA